MYPLIDTIIIIKLNILDGDDIYPTPHQRTNVAQGRF